MDDSMIITKTRNEIADDLIERSNKIYSFFWNNYMHILNPDKPGLSFDFEIDDDLLNRYYRADSVKEKAEKEKSLYKKKAVIKEWAITHKAEIDKLNNVIEECMLLKEINRTVASPLLGYDKEVRKKFKNMIALGPLFARTVIERLKEQIEDVKKYLDEGKITTEDVEIKPLEKWCKNIRFLGSEEDGKKIHRNLNEAKAINLNKWELFKSKFLDNNGQKITWHGDNMGVLVFFVGLSKLSLYNFKADNSPEIESAWNEIYSHFNGEYGEFPKNYFKKEFIERDRFKERVELFIDSYKKDSAFSALNYEEQKELNLKKRHHVRSKTVKN